VKASFEEHYAFAHLKTYTWMPGWSAFLWPVDQQIVAAVDREMARLGFVLVDSEPSDVIVTYAAMQRTDVDLKTKVTSNPELYREYRVGTLIVLLREPQTFRDVFKARGDAPLEESPDAIAQQIDSIVAEMFEQYPMRRIDYRKKMERSR